MGRHLHRHVVRFGECDAAGIVYFPRWFDWFHEAMESWFSVALGAEYARVFVERRIGFPTVHTECEYLAPCALGDTVDVALTVAELGTRSMVLAYEVVGLDGAVRARARTRVVFCDLTVPGKLKPIALPPDLRGAVEAFVGEP